MVHLTAPVKAVLSSKPFFFCLSRGFLVLTFLCLLTISFGQPLILEIEITNPNSTNIVIPTDNSFQYSYNIDWNYDGIYDEVGVTGNAVYDFGSTGTYVIALLGEFPSLRMTNETDENAEKFIDVKQWGNIEWQSMVEAFSGCKKLNVSATDIPNLSLVTSLVRLFKDTNLEVANLTNWDVSSIQDMGSMFTRSNFNENINNWDVSNVQNFTNMFSQAALFDQDLNNWDVSNSLSMEGMFNNTTFNSDISTWDTGNVENMRRMFFNTQNFNGDMANWNVSNVTTMESMFELASNFNSQIENWDLTNVENTSKMFKEATSFNAEIENWNLENNIDFSQMFYEAVSFNQPINNWTIIEAMTLESMFEGAITFNQDLNNWDLSKVTTIERMFKDAVSFNGVLNDWNTSSIENIEGVFYNATSFNQPLSNWNTSNVTHMDDAFNMAESFNQDLNEWDVRNVKRAYNLFHNSTSLDQHFENWHLENLIFAYNFFENTMISTRNYDKTLIAWSKKNYIDQPRLESLQGTNYCLSVEARNTLINDLNWSISGDNYSCSHTSISTVQLDECYSIATVPIVDSLFNTNVDVDFFDENDKLICTINANGNELGEVNVRVFLTFDKRIANIPFIGRDIIIESEFSISSPINVTTYYTIGEFEDLQKEDPTISDISDLGITIHDATCSGNIVNTGTFYAQQSSASINSNQDIAVAAEINELGTIHAHGQNILLAFDCEMLMVNIGASCDDNDLCTVDDVVLSDCTCRGTIIDNDNDGFCFSDDCDDENPDINPDAVEIPYNGLNDDCNPATPDDDLDFDGYLVETDCDDTDPDINPGAVDTEGNGIDENCDGVDGVSGVYELDNNSLTISPNPSSDFIQINWENKNNYSISLYSITGMKILEQKTKSIDVRHLNPGIYLLKVLSKSSKDFIVERIVVE